jgi:glucosylceramidase
MHKSTSRRNFLKITSAGFTAALSVKASSSFGSPAAPENPPAGSIAVRVTDAARKFAASPSLHWRSTAGAPHASEAITLDPARQYQEYLGMGGAFTDAACIMFNELSASSRAKIFHEMFHPSEMGLSVARICIGSSDYAAEVYSFDEGEPDPDLARFSIDHDRANILPILREARAANPDLFLFASPWSPPGWMKPNGSMLGGCMHPKSMPAYANYFLKFIQAYEAAGVRIDAVSSQNEVDTEQNGRMPACAWPQEYEISFVRDHLGPILSKNQIKTKIWLLDHNYNLWGRAICTLDAPGLREFSNAIAWHGYVGTPDMMTKVHEAHPDTEMFWTEGGPDITAKDYLTDWSHWSQIFTSVFRNRCRCMIGWNLALDEHGKPNVGPFSCGGTVTINSQTKEITRSGHFWAMNHFSRSVKRGARRFDSAAGPADVGHVAFENPEGQHVLILTNPGPERPVQISAGENVAEATLAKDSVTTLAWR